MNRSFELTKNELDAFPTTKEYFEQLQRLDSFDFQGKTYEEIENTYYNYAIVLPSLIIRQPYEYYSDLLLYRARLNIDNYDLGIINTHSYPNSYFCKQNGRCNLNGRTVMYCSDNPNSAIYEVNPEVGDTGYLSVWKITKGTSIKFTSLLPPDLPEGNKWISFAKESHEKNLDRWKSEYPEMFKSYRLLRAFLAEKFYKEKSPYYLSSFISNKLLYGDLHNDLIIYPSVKVNAFYCNMAIHPNFVDEYLSLKKVVRFKIFGLKNDKYKFKTGKIGEFEEGKVAWRDRNTSDNEDIFNKFEKLI